MLRRCLRPSLIVLLFLVASCATRPPPPQPPEPPAIAAPVEPPPSSIIQRGKASYYADHFHGRLTADGTTFDQNELTAASKVIPLGARAEVTNIRNGKSVMVVINDRGPHVRGRVVDLSRSAALAIGLHDGLAPVRVEARVHDQPTPALREKVAAVAAARAAKKKKREMQRADNTL